MPIVTASIALVLIPDPNMALIVSTGVGQGTLRMRAATLNVAFLLIAAVVNNSWALLAGQARSPLPRHPC